MSQARNGTPAPRRVSRNAAAFDLLLALVRRSGQLVSKDELLQDVWPGRVVEEVNLSVNISAVRKALGFADPAFIQTVSKHGYRFSVQVRALEPTPPAIIRAESSAPGSSTSRIALGPGAARAVSANPDAYRARVEGRYALSQRSEANLKKAIKCFQRAVSVVPDFAAVHAGLADCHSTLGYLSFVSPADAFPLARRHALLAVEKDAGLAEPRASLGYVRFYFDWDWPGDYYYTRHCSEAIKQLQSVLEMNPAFASAHLWLSRSYQQIGRYDDAVRDSAASKRAFQTGRSQLRHEGQSRVQPAG